MALVWEGGGGWGKGEGVEERGGAIGPQKKNPEISCVRFSVLMDMPL